MIYRFSHFVLDSERFELMRDGQAVDLQPRAMRLLLSLLRADGRLVTKNRILEEIWGGRAISDNAVSSQIKAVRKALSDTQRPHEILGTIHGEGFRIVCPVEIGTAGGNVGTQPVPASPTAAPETSPEAPPRDRKPMLAVLPFSTSRAGADQTAKNLAFALPDEIIVALSQLRSMHIIARGSSFRVGTGEDALQLARDRFGVDYALTGDLAVDGDRLTLSVQLADARTGTVAWAHRFEEPLEQVFALREQIVYRVIAAVERAIPQHEADRIRLSDPATLSAWQAYHAGMNELFRLSARNSPKAIEYFDRALELDPDFARAHAGKSHVHWWHLLQESHRDQPEVRQAMLDTAQRAVETDPLDSGGFLAMGRAIALVRDADEGLEWFDRAINFTPSHAWGYTSSASIRAFNTPKLAIDHANRALSLSPEDPYRHSMAAALAIAHLNTGDPIEGARWGREAQTTPHADLMVMITGMSTNYMVGEKEFAKRMADRIRATHPGVSIAGIERGNPMMTKEQRTSLDIIMKANGFD